jgi:3,4-dihydroxy 2-butanone 4-phosphate synthase/GTP cyclohydrolase II
LAAHEGPAVAVFVQDPDPQSISRRVAGGRQDYADRASERDYGVGAQILKDIGVGAMTLLTSSTRKMAALEGFGLQLTGRIKIRGGSDG